MSEKVLGYNTEFWPRKPRQQMELHNPDSDDEYFSRNRAADGLIVTLFSDMKHKSIGTTICVSEDKNESHDNNETTTKTVITRNDASRTKKVDMTQCKLAKIE